jgi:hypothetical protein
VHETVRPMTRTARVETLQFPSDRISGVRCVHAQCPPFLLSYRARGAPRAFSPCVARENAGSLLNRRGRSVWWAPGIRGQVADSAVRRILHANNTQSRFTTHLLPTARWGPASARSSSFYDNPVAGSCQAAYGCRFRAVTCPVLDTWRTRISVVMCTRRLTTPRTHPRRHAPA